MLEGTAPQQEMTTTPAMEPVILRSSPASRHSTALDGRSVGTGIFEFRDARAAQPPSYPPVPFDSVSSGPFESHNHWLPVPQDVPNMFPIRSRALAPPAENPIKITPKMVSIPDLKKAAEDIRTTAKMIAIPNLRKPAVNDIKITPKMISLSKEPSSSQMKLVSNEAPIVPAVINNQGRPWSVYCDECDKPIADAHFHCSICSGGEAASA